MEEPYEGVITIPVSIPAHVVEEVRPDQDTLDAMDNYVAETAQTELRSLIVQFRSARG